MEPRFICQGSGEIGLLYLRVHYIENFNVCYIKGWLLTFVVVGFFFCGGVTLCYSAFSDQRNQNQPGSSNSEPGALTTGLLDKAMVLACLRYS